ncbi:MAG TPA: ComEC/Rec2 family competence protein [Cytophagaceae bacterium]|nr:ComEC/Rec2 family competence protein [Cytophagaceae bacterium]
MIIAWTLFPFVRFLAAFISGILCYIYFRPAYDFLPAIISITVLYTIVFLFSRGKVIMHIFRPWLGFLGLTILFLCGCHISQENDQALNTDHFGKHLGDIEYYCGVVINDPEEKEKTYKTVIALEDIKTKSGWKKTSGKVYLYLKKENASLPQYGDVVLVKDAPQLVSPPGNPGEFDYQAYLARQNIFHQHFIKEEDFKITGHTEPNPILAWSISLRRKSDAILKKYIPSESEYKIASALVLGIRNSLDNEIRSAYNNTGTMHILAVSGLHIVLIFQILSLIFSPFKKIKYSEIFLPVILISLLWFYAMITGLSASVLRAVTMFTFVIIAKAINRNSNIYNTLALSAFMLLLIDPMLIMDVGFQLSYIAVLGIVYLHPKIYQSIDFKNSIVEKAWEYTSLSLAAQLATFPLGLLYFHQFPVYFLISNYLLIPVSFLALYFGLALLAVGWIPIAATVLGYLLDKIIWLMNAIVYTIEKLPLALIDGIQISQTQMILIYTAIVFVLTFLYFKKLKYLSVAFFSVMLFSSFSLIKISEQKKNISLAIYNIKGHTAIALIEGQKATLLLDSGLYDSPSKINYHIQGHLTMKGCTKINKQALNELRPDIHHLKYSGGMLIIWQGKRIFITNKKSYARLKISADIAIIGKDVFKNTSEALEYLDCQNIIFDSSNRRQNPAFTEFNY